MLATRAWTSRLPSPPGSRGRARGRCMRVVGDRSSAFAPTSGAPPRPRDVDRAKRRGADAVSVATPPDAMARRRAALVSERRSADEDDGLSPPADAHSPANDSRPPPASSLFPSLARARVAPVRLLACYDDVVACICEMGRTAAGDRVEFSVYVLEPGESTERVLRSLRRAARRGVRVDCSLDCSVISQFTRWCEGTGVGGSVDGLAAELRASCLRAAPRPDRPCHSTASGRRPRQCSAGEHRRQVQGLEGLRHPRRGRGRRGRARRQRQRRRRRANPPLGVGEAGRRSAGFGFGFDARGSRSNLGVAASIEGVAALAKGTPHDRVADGGVAYRARGRTRRRARRGGLVSNRPSGFDVVAWAAPWWRTFPGRFDGSPRSRR